MPAILLSIRSGIEALDLRYRFGRAKDFFFPGRKTTAGRGEEQHGIEMKTRQTFNFSHLRKMALRNDRLALFTRDEYYWIVKLRDQVSSDGGKELEKIEERRNDKF